MPWRDDLPVHEAANLFPMMPESDLKELGDDIRRNGLSSPIAIQIEKGKPVLLDGRNRLDALEIVGFRVRLERGNGNAGAWKLVAEQQVDGKWSRADLAPKTGVTAIVIDTDPVAYITSINIHRRHLLPGVKRDLIAKLLQENPERSDRATAELAGVDHKTVSAVRRQQEDVGSIPHVATVVDTKGRRQPTSKPKKEAKPTDGAPVFFGGPRKVRVVKASAEPTEPPADDDDDETMSPKEIAHNAKIAFLLRANEAKNFAFFPSDQKADREIIKEAELTRNAWESLVAKLKG
jgi:hypothetical protein